MWMSANWFGESITFLIMIFSPVGASMVHGISCLNFSWSKCCSSASAIFLNYSLVSVHILYLFLAFFSLVFCFP
ncbi:hypothetical protein HanRHA438_Chr04g0161181 [Helianthus annuus]|nr:hypothetical protein HanIR_Chr04g0162431 [Helianthus annuus]KAJ0925572.1 hypothetical protein HanRHA438_Chr04g0161181 [Helianthus annuus]